MVRRVVLGMALAAMAVTTPVSAGEGDSGRPPFGWALVSNGSTVATTVDELNLLDAWAPDDGRVLFARFGEDAYLIHDVATLDRVDQLVEPIRALGEKAREIRATRGTPQDKSGRRAWKERLRPLKEKRRELLLQISGEIEALARDAVRRGHAQRLN